MFGISIPLFLLILGWVFILFAVMRLENAYARGFRPRLVTILGIILVLGSFFFQDWLRLDIPSYISSPSVDVLKDAIPDVVSAMGLEHVGKMVEYLLDMSGINGWQLQFIPFFGVGTRLAVVFPSLLAILTLIWIPWGVSLRGGILCKVMGSVFIALSLLALIGLAIAIPDLDAVGVHDSVQWTMLAVLLGIHVTSGAWITMLGLVLLLVGGGVEFLDEGAGANLEQNKEVYGWQY